MPLALYLHEKSIAVLRQRGVNVFLPGGEYPKYKLIGQWTKSGKNLSLSFNVIEFLDKYEQVAAAATENVLLDKIDKNLLKIDIDSMARYLVAKLDKNLNSKSHKLEEKTVHLRPFTIRGQEGTAELGRYLSEMLRPALAQSQNFHPLDPAVRLKKIDTKTLRERSTTKNARGIRPKLKEESIETAEPMSLTGDILKAQTELLGSVDFFPDHLEIRSHINNDEGRQISAASMEMPRNLVPASLFHSPTVQKPPKHPEATSKPVPSGLSNNGLLVEIATTHGEGKTVYHKDEEIRFLVRVNRPAYVYIFNLDTEDQGTLLYPVGGINPKRLESGILLILPDDGLPYDLIVGPPYGTDIVWAVAVEKKLKFPASLEGDWSDTEVLRSRLRKQGFAKNDGYAESEVVVITKP